MHTLTDYLTLTAILGSFAALCIAFGIFMSWWIDRVVAECKLPGSDE